METPTETPIETPNETPGAGPVVGADGIARCPWGAGDPVNLAYHDTEWGLRVEGEAAHLERLTL
jgi:DNA-3-methyladenine glycosylase I